MLGVDKIRPAAIIISFAFYTINYTVCRNWKNSKEALLNISQSPIYENYTFLVYTPGYTVAEIKVAFCLLFFRINLISNYLYLQDSLSRVDNYSDLPVSMNLYIPFAPHFVDLYFLLPKLLAQGQGLFL